MKTMIYAIFNLGALVCIGLAPRLGFAAASPSCGVPELTMSIPGLPPQAQEQQTATVALPFSSSPIFDANASITERLSLANRLSRDLNEQQLTALYGFLRALPSSAEKNLSALNLLKNNLINRLQDQSRVPAGLSDALVEIWRNRSQDSVARDYALQHLVTWSEQGSGDAKDSAVKIKAVLWEAAREDNSLAGTALLGLHRLVGRSGSDGSAISRTALQLLSSPSKSAASRITAIQICAEREFFQALPAIQTLAANEGNTALRISAIGALGWLGGTEQAVFLQQLQARHDRALNPAIEGALRRLRSRLLTTPALAQRLL